MIVHTVKEKRRLIAAAAVMALAAGIMVTAAAAPVRLVGVSARDNAVLIESSEPVAYAVARPDPLTLLVDLPNVSLADARADVTRGGPIAAVRLEQAAAADGASIARIRVSLTMPAEYQVRSARQTIRVELTPDSHAPGAMESPARTAAPAAQNVNSPIQDPGPATLIERVRSRRTPSSTIVTLSGNGQLMPSSVVESQDGPRQLMLDFPDVTSKAGRQVSIDSALVKRVRLGSTREPLATRVVMDLAEDATYHVERSGPAGRDLDVVFEAAEAASGSVLLAPLPAVPAGSDDAPEPPISMEQAIRNVAAITAPGPDPITALQQTADTPAAGASSGPSSDHPPLAARNAPRRAGAAPARQAGPGSAQSPAVQSVAAQGAPQAGPAAPAVQQPAGQSDTQKKYTGHPVSLDFQGADLRAVLRGFSEISGLNMVIDPDVQGTVDIILNEVPWDQALDVILRGNQLDYTVDGTIVRIARVDTLSKENAARQALAKSAADVIPLSVRTFALSYARAASAAPLIKKAALSARGDVQIDERTNTLIVTDLPAKLDVAGNLLRTLDRAEPQVEVEARIVLTSRAFARAVGVEWGLNGRVMPDIGNTTNLAFPNQGTLGGRLGSQGPTGPRATENEQSSTAVKLGVPDASSALGLALGAVNGAFNLDVALSALEHTGKGRILSTPRLTTQNNVEAEVAQGIQIPIQTVANETVTVTFKDAVLVLKVTPQITAANTVIMKIAIENASADFSKQVNGIPPINTQRANTQVQIDDGATTIIGGIFTSQEQSSIDKTPMLNRVPLLGWLFKRDDQREESNELLIFITPRILKG
jgi:type IV pilus assembly protein PilQ